MGIKRTTDEEDFARRLSLQDIIEIALNERVLTDLSGHKESVTTPTKDTEDLVDLRKLTMIKKTSLVVHKTLDSLLAGTTELENADELQKLIAAVGAISSLAGSEHK
jgi:hypothetical protein